MHPSMMLLISDDPNIIEAARGLVGPIVGLGLSSVAGIDEAYAYPAWDRVALVLIHQVGRGPATEVQRLLRLIAAARRPVATLVLADPHDADQGLALLRLGVADYLGLPIEPGRLSYLIEILTLRARQAGGPPPGPGTPATPATPEAGPSRGPGPDDDSPEFAGLMGQVRRVAPHDTTILIGGEAGTGKTRLARQIHDLSTRRDEPFLTVNCASPSAGSIDGELFGHVPGSFAGDHRDRPGKLAEAGRGTLFLDDVDALPPTTQVRLLRAVEDRAYEPIGSDRAVPVRARLIAATARALEAEVAEGRFRSDLYYRLHVVGFHLPPLRDRRGAVAALAPRLVAEFAAGLGRQAASIDADALRALERHPWPGNFRELRGVIERCVVLSSGPTIRADDLPAAVRDRPAGPDRPTPSHSPIDRASIARIDGEAELARITRALEKHGNNRLRAAGELGISRMTLYKKLYKYGIMQHSP